MSTITKKTIEKINSSCSNGFKFDLRQWYMTTDKGLNKKLDLGDSSHIEAKLFFSTDWRNFEGTTVIRYTVCIWKPTSTEGVLKMSSHKSKYIQTVTPITRKDMKLLINLTKEEQFSDENILKFMNEAQEDGLGKILV